jgi:hypothetical protein
MYDCSLIRIAVCIVEEKYQFKMLNGGAIENLKNFGEQIMVISCLSVCLLSLHGWKTGIDETDIENLL